MRIPDPPPEMYGSVEVAPLAPVKLHIPHYKMVLVDVSFEHCAMRHLQNVAVGIPKYVKSDVDSHSLEVIFNECAIGEKARSQ